MSIIGTELNTADIRDIGLPDALGVLKECLDDWDENKARLGGFFNAASTFRLTYPNLPKPLAATGEHAIMTCLGRLALLRKSFEVRSLVTTEDEDGEGMNYTGSAAMRGQANGKQFCCSVTFAMRTKFETAVSGNIGPEIIEALEIDIQGDSAEILTFPQRERP